MGIQSQPLKDQREGSRTLFLQSDIAKQEEKQSICAGVINSPNCIKPGVQRVGFGFIYNQAERTGWNDTGHSTADKYSTMQALGGGFLVLFAALF